MAVSEAVLHQWLHSGDPRLVAWAADFAQTKHDETLTAEMPAMLEHWTMPPAYGGDASQTEQRRAILAILDVLIQQNAQVPLPAIRAVAQSFPAQAAILIERHPLSESRQTLESWAFGDQTLARTAAMTIAKDPVSSTAVIDHQLMSFVAAVVKASEVELQVTVSSDGSTPAIVSIGSICRDYRGEPLAAGWPQVYNYDLVENDNHDNASPLIDLDGDDIAFRRFKENLQPGSCYGVQDLNPVTRQRLVAHWLSTAPGGIAWRPVQSFGIAWTNKAAYQQQLGAIIEAQRDKLHAAVEQLRRRSLLTEDDVKTVMPKLVVTIKCEINPCPLD